MNCRLLFFLLLTPFFLSACLFPTKPGPGLEHFEAQAPTVGESAPHFVLQTVEGDSVSLDSLLGEKPIVLQLGSHTCPIYRYRRFGMRQLHEKYKDKAHFLLVYTLEAHPVGSKSPYSDEEWVSLWNRIPGVLIPQHESYEKRLDQAKTSQEKLKKYYQYQYLVDTIDNKVWTDYGSAASPAYVIDASGKIILRQAWVNPKEIEGALKGLIQ